MRVGSWGVEAGFGCGFVLGLDMVGAALDEGAFESVAWILFGVWSLFWSMRFEGCRWSGVERDTAACKNLDMFFIEGKDVN